MKYKIILGTLTFITFCAFSNCNSPAKNVEVAKENVNQAKEDLAKAELEYATDVANFKRESADKITANELSIAEFKSNMEKAKKTIKAEYKEQIQSLEQKNTEMRTKISEYKADSKDNWLSFKSEFNNDMDKLGASLKNFTYDNKK